MIERIHGLFLQTSAEKINTGVPRGWKKNPGVSKVEISRGTPGFGVFEEPLGIPSAYHLKENTQ